MKALFNVSIGVNPIGWSNDDLPGVGGDIGLETCLRETAAAGFAGIELGGKFPRDAGRLASSARTPWPSPSYRVGTAVICC